MYADGIDRRLTFLSFRFDIAVLGRRVLLYPAFRMLDFVLKQTKSRCSPEDF